MNIRNLIGPQLDKLQRFAVIGAIAGGLMSAVGLFLNLSGSFPGEQWFAGYLVAFMFVLGVTTGSLAWLMIGHVTGGGWAIILRRPLEAAVRNLWLVFAMFVPILIVVWFGHGTLYSWTDPQAKGLEEHVQHLIRFKSPWLNPLGFTIRALIYFVLWGVLGYFLIRWSRAQNTSNDPELARKLNTRSAFGLLIYSLTITFASIDWVMSLLPQWYSSLFGVIFAIGQGLSTLALMCVLIQGLAGETDVVKNIEPRYIRDLGNLQLGFTLLWAYTNISQFLIIWSGNLPEEAEWYHVRVSHPNGWIWVGLLLVIGHFWVPFFCFLSSGLKVSLRNLSRLGLWILAMRLIDLYFYIVPGFRPERFTLNYILSDVGLPVLLISIWLWNWARELRNEQLVPMADPRVQKSLATVQDVLDASHGAAAGGVATHA